MGKPLKYWLLFFILFSSVFNTNAQDWVFAKTAGSTVGESGSDLAIDGSGNSYVTGSFRSVATFSGTPNILLTATGGGTTNSDIFIAKYDATGNAVWAVQAGGTSVDAGAGICVDASGNIYVTGNYQGTATFYGTPNVTLIAAGGDDAFIAKYDANGNVLWAVSAGATGGNEFGRKIAVDGSGNCYVHGFFNNQCTFLGTPNITIVTNGQQDNFIAKYNASGSVLWAVKAGSTVNETAGGITVDALNNVYIGGTFSGNFILYGASNITLSTAGAVDAFVAKYDPNGNVLWAQQAGGTGNESGGNVSLDGIGNIYFSCSINSSPATFSGGSPSPVLTSNGLFDIALAKYDVATGNLAWAVNAGSAGSDNCNAVAAVGGQYIYITGAIAGSGSGTATFYGTPNLSITSFSTSSDIFIAKYAPDGQVLCVQQAGGSVNLGNTAFSIKNNGTDCYIFGNLTNTGTYPSSLGNFTVAAAATGAAGVDAMIAKWDGCPTVTVLPIELLDFTVLQNENKVDLKWTTASELNNDYFTVERSKDGVIYEKIAVINGNKKSASATNYYESDLNPHEGLSYYRLKQTDVDGKYAYSLIRNVDFKSGSLFSFDVFPNPMNDRVINIMVSRPDTRNVTLSVNDLMGKEFFSKHLTYNSEMGNKYTAVLPEKPAKGIYTVAVNVEGVYYYRKLIVE
ncbi:MAG: hypothetical protein K0S32_2536 [Bacteroidetes bacterium]|nr:hypothetical protein [Bacteroidota bacterium]